MNSLANTLLSAGYREFQQILSIDFVDPGKKETEPFIESSEDSLLKGIYVPDSITGLPQSDISVFMSKNTSPEVREFIRQQVMSPNGVSPDASVQYSSLDDDVIVQLTRNQSESLDDYRNRVVSFVNDIAKQQKKSEV